MAHSRGHTTESAPSGMLVASTSPASMPAGTPYVSVVPPTATTSCRCRAERSSGGVRALTSTLCHRLRPLGSRLAPPHDGGSRAHHTAVTTTTRADRQQNLARGERAGAPEVLPAAAAVHPWTMIVQPASSCHTKLKRLCPPRLHPRQPRDSAAGTTACYQLCAWQVRSMVGCRPPHAPACAGHPG